MSATNRRAVVVGAGDISRVHLAALGALGVEIAAVVDHDEQRAAERAAAAGSVGRTDLEAVLATGGVDVVHICTPHDQHAPVALAALAAGVNVLLEKPLAHTLAEAESIVAAAGAAGVKTGVCFQNRYNPTSQAMKQTLTSGALGPVVAASATVPWARTAAYYAAKPWAGQSRRSGGGALINQSIHTIDLLQWLIGPVTHVSGRAFRLEPIAGVDVEDTASFTMTHSPAGQAPVRSTMWATNTNGVNAPVTLDVVCERGSLSLRGDLVVTDARGVTTAVSDTPPGSDTPSYWGQSHPTLIGDFYASLERPEPFWISPADALPAQQVLSEVYRQSGLYGA